MKHARQKRFRICLDVQLETRLDAVPVVNAEAISQILRDVGSELVASSVRFYEVRTGKRRRVRAIRAISLRRED